MKTLLSEFGQKQKMSTCEKGIIKDETDEQAFTIALTTLVSGDNDQGLLTDYESIFGCRLADKSA